MKHTHFGGSHCSRLSDDFVREHHDARAGFNGFEHFEMRLRTSTWNGSRCTFSSRLVESKFSKKPAHQTGESATCSGLADEIVGDKVLCRWGLLLSDRFSPLIQLPSEFASH